MGRWSDDESKIQKADQTTRSRREQSEREEMNRQSARAGVLWKWKYKHFLISTRWWCLKRLGFGDLWATISYFYFNSIPTINISTPFQLSSKPNEIQNMENFSISILIAQKRSFVAFLVSFNSDSMSQNFSIIIKLGSVKVRRLFFIITLSWVLLYEEILSQPVDEILLFFSYEIHRKRWVHCSSSPIRTSMPQPTSLLLVAWSTLTRCDNVGTKTNLEKSLKLLLRMMEEKVQNSKHFSRTRPVNEWLTKP